MTNLTRDSALIDSDAMPPRLAHKMSASMPQSAQFVAQLSPPVKNNLHLVHAAEAGNSLNNTLSSSIGLNSAEKLDIKKAVAHRPPPELLNRPPIT
ncbi:hypothetical protein ACTXT7_014996 [Hymenolepis weldensis]